MIMVLTAWAMAAPAEIGLLATGRVVEAAVALPALFLLLRTMPSAERGMKATRGSGDP